MKTYKVDLHIHTCLSPCAELEMSPGNIVKEAKESELDIIGICDHNSCENVPYVKKSVLAEDLIIIGGMEVMSREEVHILALFEDEEALLSMQQIVYDNLQGTNDEILYGDQVVVNERDEVIDFNKKLLIGATDLTVDSIVNSIHELNGLAIASHVDRESFSLISQLGFVPKGLQIDALEVSKKEKVGEFSDLSLPLVTFSDAHRLNNIGSKFTNFFMEKANLPEMRKSLLGEENRNVIL